MSTSTDDKSFENPEFENLGFDADRLGSTREKLRNVRQNLLKTARKAAKRIPFMDDVLASYYCAIDPKTPSKVKLTALSALAYFVMPVDVIPDFLVGIGFGDDATVLIAALSLVRAHIRPEHREAAEQALREDDLFDDWQDYEVSQTEKV